MSTAVAAVLATTAQEPLPAWTGEAMAYAVKTAHSALATARRIVRPEYLSEMVIVAKPDGLLCVYKADAWTRPTERPMLPWSAPLGTPVATVSLTGDVIHLYG